MNQAAELLSPLHSSAAFELAFKIKQPQPAHPKNAVILLHGVGGSEDNLSDLAAAIPADTLVVLARGQLQIAAAQFAWFQVAFNANGPSIDAGQAERSRLSLIRFVAQIQAAYGISPQHTTIAGFSQGGIMSASVALSAPECVSAFGVLSGRILPELQPHIADKASLSQLRAFVGHGEYDSKLPVSWAHRSEQLLTELGIEHQTHLYPIDHGISPAMQADFYAWLQE